MAKQNRAGGRRAARLYWIRDDRIDLLGQPFPGWSSVMREQQDVN